MEVDKETQKELNKVTQIENKDHGKETINQNFIRLLKEKEEIGETGFKQEIVMPIPSQLVKDHKDIRKFLKKVGKISRDNTYNLPIKIDSKQEKLTNGDTLSLILVVATYRQDVKIDEVEKFLNS